MATILEALENARYNLKNATAPIQREIGINQLDNAIYLLEKGYDAFVDIETLIEKYNGIENIPDVEP